MKSKEQLKRDTAKVLKSLRKKSQEEDYAESFAYWYLYNTDGTDWSNNHWAAPDNPINKRARYFEDLFEKEENDDDGEDDDN